MTSTSASDLIAFINESISDHGGHHHHRFIASSIYFDGQTWVLIRDNYAPDGIFSIEPILHVSAYLERADRPKPLDPEFRQLLEMWQESPG